MQKDLDEELYNDYLNGEREAFEFLYNKYKSKIEYFIYTIIKNYEIAEDLTQETFIYVMQNKMREDSSFKYYIYLVAKSKAFNYVKKEKRRNEITEQYLRNENKEIEEDILDIIEKEEMKKELLESIALLDERYRNAIYLVNIAGLSYEETASILNETLQNTKNLIHRGKIQLKKILLKKGFDKMNKVSKMFVILLFASIILSGAVYATIKIVENFKGKAEMNPISTSKISSLDTNKVWIGTFNLVWSDFMNDVIGGNIEFEDGYSALADELNKQNFKEDQLNEKSFYKVHGSASQKLKETIENAIKTKFNENSEILNNIDWNDGNSYILYAMLKKEFNFLEPFQTLDDDTFANSTEKVKYFGIEPDRSGEARSNGEILFYNNENDCAIKLKTLEGEDVILYKTTGEGKSFEENYAELVEKSNKYTGTRDLQEDDALKIPYIKLKCDINYDELCGRYIKGTEMYIRQALQTVNFELNNYGGSVKSEALISMAQGDNTKNRFFNFNSDFILFLKENSKEKPYFALKVDNTDILQLSDN